MTATNHALTGTAIGLIVGIPILALPLAFLSHFICDAIPHYGSSDRDAVLKTKAFKYYLVLEASLCFLIVLSLALFHPEHWQLAAVCAFLAASPDLYWIKRFIAVNRNTKWKADKFAKFASEVQWFQNPIRYVASVGVIVEIGWLSGTLMLILPYLSTGKNII